MAEEVAKINNREVVQASTYTNIKLLSASIYSW